MAEVLQGSLQWFDGVVASVVDSTAAASGRKPQETCMGSFRPPDLRP